MRDQNLIGGEWRLAGDGGTDDVLDPATGSGVGTVLAIPIVSEMPYGGFNQSGDGKDMSMDAVEHATEVKPAMVEH